MNKFIGIGRLVKDPEIRVSNGDMYVARYTLACDRKFKKEGEQAADFINCVAFGKQGEFADKYLRKGTKIAITGRIQTGSYKNKDGQTVYTTDVVVEEQEFAESKASQSASAQSDKPQEPADKWVNIADNIDEELPFL